MEVIQERTLDIGVLCSSANYIGTIKYYRVIKHNYIGTHIMNCLVKGTLSRQPWFVFCVRRGAGGIARAAMLVHPKAASLLIRGGEKRRRRAKAKKTQRVHLSADRQSTRVQARALRFSRHTKHGIS
jgi:hypothetical protein